MTILNITTLKQEIQAIDIAMKKNKIGHGASTRIVLGACQKSFDIAATNLPVSI